MYLQLSKALDKNKLVQVPVQVKGKTGIFTRQQWKKIGDLTSDEMKAAGINLAQKGFRKANPETKAFVDNLAKELGDEKLLEEIKARGITWSENSNVGINKMHAKMRLREWLEDGGTWDSSKTKEKPDPFVDAIKEFVSKLTSTSRVTEARAMEMAQELVNKADLGDISYLLERLNAGNPLSIKLFGSIKGIKIKTQKDVRAALEKFYPEKWKEYHEKLAQERKEAAERKAQEPKPEKPKKIPKDQQKAEFKLDQTKIRYEGEVYTYRQFIDKLFEEKGMDIKVDTVTVGIIPEVRIFNADGTYHRFVDKYVAGYIRQKYDSIVETRIAEEIEAEARDRAENPDEYLSDDDLDAFLSGKPVNLRPKGYQDFNNHSEIHDFIKEVLNLSEVDLSKLGLPVANGIGRVVEEATRKFPEFSQVFKNCKAAISTTQVDSKIWALCKQKLEYATPGAFKADLVLNMLINEINFKDNDKVIAEHKKGESNGYMSKTDKPYATIIHELAHMLDAYITDKSGDSWYSEQMYQHVMSELRSEGWKLKSIQKEKEAVMYGLGRYATANDAEFFAEALKEYILSDNPRQIAKIVGERVKKDLQGIM